MQAMIPYLRTRPVRGLEAEPKPQYGFATNHRF